MTKDERNMRLAKSIALLAERLQNDLDEPKRLVYRLTSALDDLREDMQRLFDAHDSSDNCCDYGEHPMERKIDDLMHRAMASLSRVEEARRELDEYYG
jgi:hypothetical protein